MIRSILWWLLAVLLALAATFVISNNTAKEKVTHKSVSGKIVDARQSLGPLVYKAKLDRSEVDCLARNIFYEAGVEPYRGKIAVAQVTINRIGMKKRWDSICKVVYAKAQFSWTLDPKKKHARPKGPLWEASKKAAIDFLHGKEIEALIDSDHYHADYVNPEWSKKMVKIKKIGRHIFYKSKQGGAKNS
jgi:spore germination cell wall hydrolase CwlJ-like protein